MTDLHVKPMLAATAGPGDIRPGYLVSPKLDGIRAVNVNGSLLSRSLKPIPNRHLQAVWSGADLHGLDGELIVGDPTAPDVYRITMSAVMSRDGAPAAVLYLFDDFSDPARPYDARLESLTARASRLQTAGLAVQVLPQLAVSATNPLEAVESALLAEGYEGLIARRPDTRYKFGRSTVKEAALLKLKRFADGEAVVMRATELKRNVNEAAPNALGLTARSSRQEGLIPGGTLGMLEVQDVATGIFFGIGSGFDQATRDRLWAERDRLPGRLITYRHFPLGAYDKPRFPTFKGMRHADDCAA